MIGKFIVPIYLYGVLMTIAFLIGLIAFRANLKKTSVTTAVFIDFALIFSFSAIIGSRIMYILLYPVQFESLQDYFALHEGGMVFYGGFILAFLNSVIYIKAKKISLSRVADSVAPAISIGHCIGRLGCYSNGCCYGHITKNISIYHLSCDPAGVFRHPTQLYEAVFLFILFLGLQKLLTKIYCYKKFFIGLVGGIYLFAYSSFRFAIEFIRGDDRGGFFTSFHLSVSQCVSIIMFLVAAVWLAYTRRTHETAE